MMIMNLIHGVIVAMMTVAFMWYLSACKPVETKPVVTDQVPTIVGEIPVVVSPAVSEPTPAPTAKPTATPKPQPTPVPAKRTTVTVTVTGGTEKQRARLTRIAHEVEPIINSAKFKERVLGAAYKGKLGFYKTSLTNQQVYDRFMKGDELKKGKPDHHWTPQLKIAKLKAGRLGEMNWGSLELRFNSLYLDGRKDSGLAGTLCHEYAHLLGLMHDTEQTSANAYSVPYATGTICAEIYSPKQ